LWNGQPWDLDRIPSTLQQPAATRFWLALTLTGISTGIGAAVLTRSLEWVQRHAWGGNGTDLLNAAQRADAWRHIAVLLGAGVVTALGQFLMRQLSSANGIDTTVEVVNVRRLQIRPGRLIVAAILSSHGIGYGSVPPLAVLREPCYC
jgi:chloride channel protein, CIC family